MTNQIIKYIEKIADKKISEVQKIDKNKVKIKDISKEVKVMNFADLSY